MKQKSYIKDLFLRPRLFWLLTAVVLLYIISMQVPILMIIAHFVLLGTLLFFFIEYAILFFTKNQIYLQRHMDDVLSNTDDNRISIELLNEFALPLNISMIDELPVQFQERRFSIKEKLKANEDKTIRYKLRPTTRGEYHFGKTHVYANTSIGLVQRRFSSANNFMVKVYPSYLKLKQYSIRGVASKDQLSGSRKVRKGMSTEFDQIKDYVRGDDVRTINWKATARRSNFMVNTYMDEKSQQVFCIIDKSRLMKMPFDGVSLLDYSINASLMFSYVALQKDDKVGLITFSSKINDVIKASKSRKQFSVIVERLYNQTTNFQESDYGDLQLAVKKEVGQRSLLLLFTNFETYVGFERKLPYFRMLNKKHLLCVVLFENTELKNIHEERGNSLEDIYIKTMADKYNYEKKMMLKELRKNGILSIYSAPGDLSVNVVNKYLDLKTKRYI